MCCLFAATSAQVQIRIDQGDTKQKMEPIDDELFAVEYEMKFIADTSKRDKVQTEMMMLKVGQKLSSFYSYSRWLADSALTALKKSGTQPSVDAIIETSKKYQSRISYSLYKNYPQNKVTTLDELAKGRYRCEENNDMPEWELLPDETATVLNYPCQKAVCHFKGRDYEAWFTPDIARGEGPWKLYGLPGLILRAHDAQKEYVFEAVALKQAKENDKITFGAEGYESVSRKDLNKLFERYAADPIGFLKSSAPNIRVMIKDDTGAEIKPKNTPYNPIEKN